MKPLDTTVTFLEMKRRPVRIASPQPRVQTQLMRAERPTVGFYRYLYEAVGRPWVWVNRRRMNDADLAQTLAEPGLEIHVLYAHGEPAGYGELDARNPADIELAYFGLTPQFTGLGLGAFFLGAMIDIAWDKAPERLHVQTCTLDHPRALPLYQRMGFTPFSRTTAYVQPIGDEPHPRVKAQKGITTAA